MAFLRTVAAVIITAIITSGLWLIMWPMLIERDGWFREMAGLAPIADIQSGAYMGAEGDAVLPANRAQRSLVERDVASAANGLVIPVQGIAPTALTDTFSQDRAEGARAHQALDIMAVTGTPVVAAAPGMVEKLFQSRDGGNTVYVRSNDRQTLYYYAHLDQYARGLREGDRVESGDALGTVGNSGNAEPGSPHLHFAVSRVAPKANWSDEGEPINPFDLLTGR